MKGDTQNGFRLKGWQVYQLRNLLVGPAGEIHIEPKVMQVLESLASNPGQVVERETLLNDIWDGRAFSDEPLTRCIAALRHALDDDPHDPKYIQTIPKRGYRLVCPVESLDDARDQVGRRIALRAFLGLVLITAVVMTYLSMLSSPVESPQLSIEGTTQTAPSRYSIAVLPFRNRSAVAEDAFFVDGIHDDILMQLAKLSSLDKVISRTSMERYRETTKPLPQIGEELGVASILEGSVQRSGDRVHINVQLIDAQTDEHLWAETYDRELTAENLFAIQSEISRDIVGALQGVLTDEDNERLQAMPTTSLEAYSEFVLGHREMAKQTAEELFRSQAHFEKAIELDPNYALAYIGLADSLTLQFAYGFLEYADGFLIFADSPVTRQSAIDMALALDPMSGEAYTSLAALKVTESKDEEAEKHFLKALELSPNYATAHQWYAMYLSGFGRYEEALPHIRKAVELDPMVPALTATLGSLLWNLGRVEAAQAALRKGIERNPEYPGFYRTMSGQLQSLGRIGEAVKWQRAAAMLAPSNFRIVVWECYLYLELGADQSAERCYESVEETFGERAFGRKVYLYLFRSQMEEAAKLTNQLAQRDLGHSMMGFLATSHFNIGEFDKARAIWQDLWPKLYSDEDIIVNANEMPKNWSEIQKIAHVAYTLTVDGQLNRANYLFDHVLETMQSMHRVRGPGYDEMDVFIHAARGEKRKAISALREAIDMGWRRGWWVLRLPIYDAMREEPEWIALLDELEADIARQRQWYEDHKDDPLF